MPRSLRLAYFAHSIRSDWNNGNAHFLRGLLRSLGDLGHEVTTFEPVKSWSLVNLLEEPMGSRSLLQFAEIYPMLRVTPYSLIQGSAMELQPGALRGFDVVIVHEWNSPELAQRLLGYREKLGFQLLFHDTHHRASSSPAQIHMFGIDRFDAVIAFGEALRRIYRERFGIANVLTLHEAADIDVFYPRPSEQKTDEVIWIGNWGDGERSAEISEYLLQPVARLKTLRCGVYGVRYPEAGLQALREAHVSYRGYLANLEAPQRYSCAALTVHIPRQQYAGAMTGIPTIRVFEALASGIPLISAPWRDAEGLFREGDYQMVSNGAAMELAMAATLRDPAAADAQALRGLETVRARHTCRHRAIELTSFCEELCQ